MHDHIPSGDKQYAAWMAGLLKGLEPMLDDLGLPRACFDELKRLSEDYARNVQTLRQKEAEYRGSVSAKAASRKALEASTRQIVRMISYHPKLDNATRMSLGLNPKGLVHPKPKIASLRPRVRLEAHTGMVTVHWGPMPSKRNRNGKPRGVRGANIYRRKAGEAQWELRGFSTASPFRDAVAGPATDWEYAVQYAGTKEVSERSDPQVIAARGELAA